MPSRFADLRWSSPPARTAEPQSCDSVRGFPERRQRTFPQTAAFHQQQPRRLSRPSARNLYDPYRLPRLESTAELNVAKIWRLRLRITDSANGLTLPNAQVRAC